MHSTPLTLCTPRPRHLPHHRVCLCGLLVWLLFSIPPMSERSPFCTIFQESHPLYLDSNATAINGTIIVSWFLKSPPFFLPFLGGRGQQVCPRGGPVTPQVSWVVAVDSGQRAGGLWAALGLVPARMQE